MLDMDFQANTGLARALADTMTATSAAADEQVKSSLGALEIAELFADTPGDLVFFGEDLRRASIILNTQLDLLEGFELDLYVLAEALRVDRFTLEQQLAGIEESTLGDAGILPLLGWDGYEITPTDLREVFIGLPSTGTDPALDAAIERLNDWLLPLLLQGESRQLRLTDQQESDLRLLGTALGADLIVFRESEKYRGAGGDDAYRIRTYTLVEIGGQRLLDWVFDAFEKDRALGRLAASPPFDEVVAELYSGSDSDAVLTRAQGLEIVEANLVDWLLGRVPLPADPEARAELIAFARLLGLDVNTADQALTALQRRRALQELVVVGDPTDGEVLFTEGFIEGQIAFAIRIGAITEKQFADAAFIADYVLAIALDGDTAGRALDDEGIELDPTLLVQAILARIPIGFFTEDQLFAAIGYITAGATLGEQRERLAHTLLAFRSASTHGVATFTQSQWKSDIIGDSIVDKIAGKFGSRLRIQADNEIFQYLVSSIGVPGHHKLKLSKRVRLHLLIDGQGQVADFIIEERPRKSTGRFIIGAVLTVIALVVTVVAPPAAPAFYAIASAYNAYLAFDAGDEIGGIIALLGAFASFAQLAGAAQVANAARAAQVGLQAHRAFEQGDIVAGIGYSLIAIGIGADIAAGQTVGGIIVGVDNVVEGIEDGNIGQIVDGAISVGIAATSILESALPEPEIPPTQYVLDPVGDLEAIRNTLEDLRQVAVPAVQAVEAFSDDDVLVGIANTLAAASAGAAAFANTDGYLSRAFDVSTGDRIELATFADFGAAAALIVEGIDAATNDDYLRLLARLGEAATIIINDPTATAAVRAEQLSRIAGVLDLLTNLDPETTDPSLFGELLGAELVGLIKSFEPPPSGPTQAQVDAESALLDAEATAIAEANQPQIRVEELPPLEQPGPDSSEDLEGPPSSAGLGNPADGVDGTGADATAAIPTVDSTEPGLATAAGVYDSVIGALGDELTEQLNALPAGASQEIKLVPGQASSTLVEDGVTVLTGQSQIEASIVVAKNADGSVTLDITQNTEFGQTNTDLPVPITGGLAQKVGFKVTVSPPENQQFQGFPDILNPLNDADFTEGTTVTIEPYHTVGGSLSGRLGGKLPFGLGEGSVSAGGGLDFTRLESISITRETDAITITETFGEGTTLGGSAGGSLQTPALGGLGSIFGVDVSAGLGTADLESVSIVTTVDPATFDQSAYFDHITGIPAADATTRTSVGTNTSGSIGGGIKVGPDQFSLTTDFRLEFTFVDQEIALVETPGSDPRIEFQREANGVTIQGAAGADGSDALIEVTVGGETIVLSQSDLDLLTGPRGIDDTPTALLGTDRFPDLIDNPLSQFQTDQLRFEWDRNLNLAVEEIGRIGDAASDAGLDFPPLGQNRVPLATIP